ATGVHVLEIFHGFRQQIEKQQILLERVLGEFGGAGGEAVEELHVLLQIALDEGPGQFPLAGKVVEKPALGDMGPVQNVVDGGGGKSLLQDDGLRYLKDFLSPVL